MSLPDSIIQKLSVEEELAIITIGRTSGEFADRSLKDDFNLSETEQDLLEKVCAAFHAQHKRVVVILNICGVIETASWKALPDAILITWLAGQEGGNAVADILTGLVSPSGKLTMTFPLSYEDVPSYANFPLAGSGSSIDSTRYDEGLFVGYRYYDTYNKPVSYPFGYGLSYTEFEYSHLMIEEEDDNIRISCQITNKGKRDGKEIAQLYIAAPDSSNTSPSKELKAFAKTRLLSPGETDKVTFILSQSELARYDESTDSWKQPSGKLKIFINSSVSDYRLDNINK